jgi:hypothetical protein
MENLPTGQKRAMRRTFLAGFFVAPLWLAAANAAGIGAKKNLLPQADTSAEKKRVVARAKRRARNHPQFPYSPAVAMVIATA